MSGHSHFSTIKRKKEATDKKRGQIFSKLAKVISIAAKKGSDPNANPSLRLAIETAKKFNMPKENVERAIRRGTGQDASENLEEFVFEAYGPGGLAIIIEGITDNKNRALGEIRQILSQNKGKLAGEGSVRWLFERKGSIEIELASQKDELKDKEKFELLGIEAGAEDIYLSEETLYLYCKPENLEDLKKNLEAKEAKIENTSLGWVAKETIEISLEDKNACEKLFEELDDNEAVQDVYSNLKL